MVEDGGIRLASPRDIAAMKINAIEGRGTRKNFIDIFFLLQHYSLEELLGFYQQKYPEHSIFRALMSLTYFIDAEEQNMPTMYYKAIVCLLLHYNRTWCVDHYTTDS